MPASIPPASHTTFHAMNEMSAFAALSAELMHLVAAYLDLHAQCALRLTCRHTEFVLKDNLDFQTRFASPQFLLSNDGLLEHEASTKNSRLSYHVRKLPSKAVPSDDP